MSRFVYLPNVVSLQLNEDRCTGCGMCAVVCPHGVMALDNGRAFTTDRDACMECGACAQNCPADAIFVQVGVGCAQAVINTALGRKGNICCSTESGSEVESDCSAPTESNSGCC
ncbi:4Fe-4S dicluster domain-containing protein [bacterium]|nr:MAG: 4Fe-4S dicluster domain-containing protein [bacterium]